ncbi:preprotein translocase, SecG subunit [Acetobacteraceae bacterium AT-5844]|nr:preprotein translocase, SecG subunit [Acetobacteraceae bacterium AT-5844]
MMTVLLVLHLIVTLALIAVVLLQRSEGGGLGIGSSQGMGSFMTGRGTANLLTRTTAVLATLFMVLALAMALLGRGEANRGSILDLPPGPAIPAAPTAPGGTAPAPGASGPATDSPATGAPAAPAAPAQPSVPTN